MLREQKATNPEDDDFEDTDGDFDDDDATYPDEEAYPDDYDLDPSEVEEGAGLDDERPVRRAHGGIQGVRRLGHLTAEEERFIQEAEMKRSRDERAAKEARAIALHAHAVAAHKACTPIGDCPQCLGHRQYPAELGKPHPWEVCPCVHRERALLSLGPLAHVQQIARPSLLAGRQGQSLLVTGPWAVVAAHARKALLAAQRARADGGERLLRTNITTDAELYLHDKAQMLAEMSARGALDEVAVPEDEEEDDAPQKPYPAGIQYDLTIIRIGRHVRREPMANYALAQAVATRRFSYSRPSWVVTETPWAKGHPRWNPRLAADFGSLSKISLSKEDL